MINPTYFGSVAVDNRAMAIAAAVDLWRSEVNDPHRVRNRSDVTASDLVLGGLLPGLGYRDVRLAASRIATALDNVDLAVGIDHRDVYVPAHQRAEIEMEVVYRRVAEAREASVRACAQRGLPVPA